MRLPADCSIERIDAFQDNYIWLLRRGTQVAIVDPGDALPVLDYLAAKRLTPVAILATHHHGDHVGGIARIRKKFPVPVFGPAGESIPQCTAPLSGGEQISLPELRLEFAVLSMPGHTRAAVAYAGHGVLFCGDTLFGGGCGRLFEGTADQLFASLQRLAQLPPDTLVYCAHEYTLANLLFAQAVEPANDPLAARIAETRRLRATGTATVPSTLAIELETNPFLRCDRSTVRQAVQNHSAGALHSAAEVFAAVRRWKDGFKPPQE